MTPHDGPVATDRRAGVRDREDALVARLRSLGTAIDGEPDPEFRSAFRARLVAIAAVRSPGPAAARPIWRRLLAVRADDAPPERRGRRLTAGLAAAALAVTAVATLVAVSTGAGPGDVLYGLKRGTERTQLALAGDSRGQTLLQFAGTRLAELADLPAGQDAPLMVSTLRTMDDQSTEGAAWLTSRAVETRSSAPVRDLAAWTEDQRAGLAALQPRAPAGARDAVAGSLDLLSRIGARAAALTTALSCASGPATNGADALGPVPAPCPAGTSEKGGANTAPPGSAPDVGTAGSLPSPGAPGGPVTGSTAGPAGGTGPGSGGGGTTVNPIPGSVVPATPSPIVTVPLPSGPIPLPGQPAPPSGTTSGDEGGGLGICLPPLQVGSC